MQLHQVYDQVLETGTKIFAISVDGPDKAKAMKEKTSIEFDILCDENLEVIKMYGLEDEEQTVWDFIEGKSRNTSQLRTISLSANILIDKKGTVISEWKGHYNFRPAAETTIELLKKM